METVKVFVRWKNVVQKRTKYRNLIGSMRFPLLVHYLILINSELPATYCQHTLHITRFYKEKGKRIFLEEHSLLKKRKMKKKRTGKSERTKA